MCALSAVLKINLEDNSPIGQPREDANQSENSHAVFVCLVSLTNVLSAEMAAKFYTRKLFKLVANKVVNQCVAFEH